MTRYHSILGQLISSLLPAEKIAVPSPILSGKHINDAVCFGTVMPLIADTVQSIVPQDVLNQFVNFTGDRDVVFRQVRTNTEDETAIRNVTVWLGPNVTIGGMSVSWHMKESARNELTGSYSSTSLHRARAPTSPV